MDACKYTILIKNKAIKLNFNKGLTFRRLDIVWIEFANVFYFHCFESSSNKKYDVFTIRIPRIPAFARLPEE